MNRGFGTYFSGGIKAAVNTVYKNKGFLNYWLYTAMGFIGRIFLIFFPVFALSDIRQAKIAHADNNAVLAENFRVACKANSLWAYIGARLIEFLIFLAGTLLIGIATGVLALLGFLVSVAAEDFSQELLIIIFCIPGMVAELMYIVMAHIMFAPTAYIVESNPGISAAAAVSASLKTMKRCGKWTYVSTTVLPMLIISSIMGFLALAVALVSLFVEDPIENMIGTCILIFVLIAAFFLIFPIFQMTMKVAHKSLFEDISLDPVNASKHTSGVNIKGCKGVLFPPETIEENLNVLFNETEEENAPLPTSAAKKKHDKSARAGVQKVDLSDGEDLQNDNSDRQGRS
ncbi:MAG: hypothetical protein K2L02_00050 [Clostridia bacterium]|nr:hypothetical protein [Clostridia bacterium]